MEQPGLSKHQTTVVRVLFTTVLLALVFVSNEGRAQTPPVAPAYPYPYPQPSSGGCFDAISKIGEAVAAGNTACGGRRDCMEKALNCESSQFSSATSSLGGASIGESCDSLVNTVCLDQNVGASQSAREEKRDAGRTRKEATEAKESAAAEFQKAQNDALEKQNEAAKQMVELRKQYRDERQKITEEEEKSMSEATQAKMQAVKEAQKQYDDIDTAYITMRDELRTAADKISNGDLTWKTQCRAVALTKSKEVQAAMDKRMAEEDAQVNQINNQASGLFGLKFRRMSKKRKRIADEYNEVLVRCLKGELDPGMSMKIELDKARLEYTRKEKLAQDKAAQLESRRKNLATQLETLQKSVDEQQAKKVAQLKQRLANAEEDFNQNMQLAQQQQAAAQQNAQQSQQANLKKLEQADRDLQAASRDQTLASNRLLCADRHGGKATASSAATTTANVTAARKALGQARTYCTALPSLCSGRNASQQSLDERTLQQLRDGECTQITNMLNSTSGSGSSLGTGGSTGVQ
jgi:membrane protein involved in colicin uptake